MNVSKYQKTAPVDVEAVAKDLGLEIFRQDLGQGISGKLLKEDGKFMILVNKNEPHVRQRFTAAHEIGHYLLHRDLIGEQFEENYMLRSDKTSNAQEAEANKYAAELLMPFVLIQHLMQQGYKTIDELADQLQVSKIALGIRLGLPT